MPSSPLHLQTPLFENGAINQRLSKRIHLKMECYQPVGSFKIRGIGHLCQTAAAAGKGHLICSSGGNAGYAAAYAGQRLGLPVTVVVPETTPLVARARMSAEGAEVIVHGKNWNEADGLARQLVQEKSGAYIHPFDHPAVWAGHATMIDEVVKQGPKPERVVVAVGGGGLLSGVVMGLQRCGWGDIPLLAVETEGAASFAAALKAGQPTMLPEITSIANTLGAKQVTDQALACAEQQPITSVIVSDRSAVEACLRFADEQRVIVEPACGAALSLLYDHADVLAEATSALVIVCGGAGATLEQLLAWQQMLS